MRHTCMSTQAELRNLYFLCPPPSPLLSSVWPSPPIACRPRNFALTRPRDGLTPLKRQLIRASQLIRFFGIVVTSTRYNELRSLRNGTFRLVVACSSARVAIARDARETHMISEAAFRNGL